MAHAIEMIEDTKTSEEPCCYYLHTFKVATEKNLQSQLTELSEAIITDDSSRSRPLTDDNRARLKKALLSRLIQCRQRGEWPQCLGWADMIIRLLDNDNSQDDKHSMILHKVDILINMNRFSEAFDLSITTLKIYRNPASMIIAFKAAIHCKMPYEAVEVISKHLFDQDFNLRYEIPSEILSVLERCCHVTCPESRSKLTRHA